MTISPQSGLVATNVRCQKLLEHIPHLAWLMTDSSSVVWEGWGEILTVNQRWQEYIGQTSGADVAEPILDIGVAFTRSTRPWIFAEILHAEDRDRFLHSWAEARRLQEPLALKLQLQRGSGDWEWFTVELEPDRDESGQTIWICTAIRLGGQAAIPSHQQPLQFLEALLDNASDGIVACDADGQLVLFNRMAQVFHGLPPEPIDPEEWANYYDLCDRDGIRNLPKSEIPLFRALQGESVVSQEITIKSKQGEARSLLANGTAIYSPTGEKLGAVVLMRDITADNQTLAALQNSEQKFRAIFDGVFQFIGLLEPDGTLVEANQTALQFGGMEAEEAIGRPLWDIPGWKFAPADRQQLQSSIARAAQGEFIRYEVEVMGAGDLLVPLDFSLMPILDPAGEVTLIIPEGRDIRQIKQSESERLRTQLYSERLSVALRGGKAGAWNWDLVDRDVVLWTPEFETLFDYEPGSSKQLYSEWRDRVHPEDLERVETLLQETIDRKLPEFRYEYRIVWRDGQIRWMDAIGELHTDELDNLRMSGLVYDITDRKQLELLGQSQSTELQRLNAALLLTQQQLEERNQELDRFVYIAAHDLKAPLRSISNLSEWIEEDTIDLIPAANQQQFQLLRQRVQSARLDRGLVSARTAASPTASLRQRVQGACFLFTCLKTVK
jgi:PAS domain S-box-containing protein